MLIPRGTCSGRVVRWVQVNWEHYRQAPKCFVLLVGYHDRLAIQWRKCFVHVRLGQNQCLRGLVQLHEYAPFPAPHHYLA